MKKRNAVTEIISVQSDGETPVYVPFANSEMLQSVNVKDKGVVATFRAVEGNVELGGVTTSKENESVSMGNAKTVCVIIETQQATEFELLTIK